jgi:methanogenic corrinoid protein MtbC1
MALKEAGVRDNVKVILGGAPITAAYAKKVGADYGARDAIDGVAQCKTWLASV